MIELFHRIENAYWRWKTRRVNRKAKAHTAKHYVSPRRKS